MTFGTDKQTLSDLTIFPPSKREASVFGIYNKTVTLGGNDELYKMMDNPFCCKSEIENRIRIFNYLSHNHIEIPFDKNDLDFIEFYLNQNCKPLHDTIIDAYVNRISYKLKPNNDYYILSRGVEYLKRYLSFLHQVLEDLPEENIPSFFIDFKLEINRLKNHPNTKALFLKKEKLSFKNVNHFDNLFRGHLKSAIKNILRLTYQIDAFQSVSKSAALSGFTFPAFEDTKQPFVEIHDLFHPLLKSPVKNFVQMKDGKNLLFLTGSNMSGKSTFLKAVGICVYLAHLGFPVPAQSMKLSVFNGLYTTINLPDDIFKGYSHYYSEVRRLKDIALKIKEKKNVFVIFDELFRGTNVKDAQDATLLVTSGFSKTTKSIFLISTHILEVGEELKNHRSIMFKCFESFLENEKPIFTYTLADGISSERLGLTILQNEGVLSLIEEISQA